MEWVKTGKVKTYIETSAFKNIGIDEVFKSVAENA